VKIGQRFVVMLKDRPPIISNKTTYFFTEGPTPARTVFLLSNHPFIRVQGKYETAPTFLATVECVQVPTSGAYCWGLYKFVEND
jgi:hypothetical protein